MTDATRFMLCAVYACVAGYPDSVIKQYADVFQKIIDNDKHLQGQNGIVTRYMRTIKSILERWMWNDD